ncbi:putative Zn-dependent peptidase [uncultured Woeseiaceae bacterium]|uniref:Putative Zn-dependent peptidase n=1 Tax=uncultured Woeseiaceae bacterium TaxID=1983305 RepID=A0A7D9H4F3_9GAMM|nr:putative Zn-dependent peptidase [uncultured Woeseiaceae bacterium]
MKKLIVLAVFFATPSLSQDLTHPHDMGLPDSDYTRPDPAEYQLSLENGLIAYVAEAGQVPLVTMSAFIRAGLVNDESQGAAESLQDALKNSGPSGTSSSDFEASLKQMTAEFVVEMHDEWTEITLNVPAEDLDQALSIFAALLRDPAISEANIERAATGVAPEVNDLGGESGAALYEGSMNTAVDRFYEIIYKGHPYGRRPTTDDFNDLNAADVANFHARYFVPGNMTIAVAGAIDLEEINGRLVDLFGDWAAAEVPEVKQMPAISRTRAALHHIPSNKLQSWMVIGHDLPPVPLREQAALEVMNYIMGAVHLNTRMMRETRYKYGYTNDASGFLEDQWYGPGSYTFRSYSRPEVIENIYENMMGEIIRIRNEEVTEHEMFVAKGALADGSFPVRYLDGYALTRNFALERLRYGHHKRSASFVKRILAVSKDDVLNAARKYLRPNEMQVILVGEDAFPLY